MINKLTFFIILFAAILISCNQPTSPLINNPNGYFKGRVVLYDSTGSNPIYGTLTLNRSGSKDLTGSWDLGNGNSGKLAGSIINDSLAINLNPNIVDGNTFLFGTTDGKTIKGKWYYSGFAGIMNKGTFIATNNTYPF